MAGNGGCGCGSGCGGGGVGRGNGSGRGTGNGNGNGNGMGNGMRNGNGNPFAALTSLPGNGRAMPSAQKMQALLPILMRMMGNNGRGISAAAGRPPRPRSFVGF